MSSMRSASATLGLCALLCAACAHTGHGETTVILAGSVCSGLPQLTAAAATANAASAAAPEQPESLVAYVTPVAAGGGKLVVYDLQAGRARFEVPAIFRSRPQLLRDVVVAVEEKDGQNRLVAYDLKSGQLRAAHPVPRASWLGAVQVGRDIVFTSSSLSFLPSERGSTVTALDAATGALRWERLVPYALSRPSAATADGDRVYLISDHADVWALEADSGDSVGCSRLGTEPVEWLTAHGDTLLLGTQDAREVQLAQSAPSDLGRLQLPISELPGQPLLQPSAYQSVPATRSAFGRISLVAPLTAAAAKPELTGAGYFYTFYKHLFAFDQAGQLRWAHKLDADSAELRASAAAVRVITESGQVLTFSAQTGAPLASAQLPDRLTSVDSTQRGLPDADAAATAAANPQDLRSSLRALALDTDARLLPSRKLSVSALAALPAAEATQDLLDVYTQPSAPNELRTQVARVLAVRRVGSEHLVAALAGDYNFLSGEPAPPLAAIVPGLVENNEQRAVPRLIDRLFDPDTRLSELHMLVDAIAKLGGKDAKKPLAEFFALYHADSSLADDASALLAAAEALLKDGQATAGRQVATELALIDAAAKDPSTLDVVKAGLVPLLATAAPPPPAKPEEQAQAEEPEPEAPVLLRLNDAAISSAFGSHAGELRECITAELARNSGLRSLRFHLVIESSGKLSRFSVWPKRAELLECLQPKLEALQFPAFARGRRFASYTLALKSDALRDEDAASAQEDKKPFWFIAQLRGVGAPSAQDQLPWWQNQNPLYVSVEDSAKSTPQIEPQPAAQPTPPKEQAPTPSAADGSKKPAQQKQPEPPAPKPSEEKPSTDQWWLPAQPAQP